MTTQELGSKITKVADGALLTILAFGAFSLSQEPAKPPAALPAEQGPARSGWELPIGPTQQPVCLPNLSDYVQTEKEGWVDVPPGRAPFTKFWFTSCTPGENGRIITYEANGKRYNAVVIDSETGASASSLSIRPALAGPK